MKNTRSRLSTGKRFLFAGLTAFALVAFTACEKGDDNDPGDMSRFKLSGSASGDQEVPAVSTSAKGSLNGSYDSISNRLIYTIEWDGLSGEANMAHFHGPALAGENADVMLPLTMVDMGASGRATDTVEVNDAFEDALLEGKVYYNIHTLANPAGEIRGQVNTTRN